MILLLSPGPDADPECCWFQCRPESGPGPVLVWLVSMNPGHATVQAISPIYSPLCEILDECALLIPSSIGNGSQLSLCADCPSSRRRHGTVAESQKTRPRQLELAGRAHAGDAEHRGRSQRLVSQLSSRSARRPALPLLLAVLQLLQLEHMRVRRVRRDGRACGRRRVWVRSGCWRRRVGRRHRAQSLWVKGPGAVAEPAGAEDLDLLVLSQAH